MMAAETRSAECRWRAGRPGRFVYGAIRLLDRLSDAFSTRLRHPRTASRTPDARTACDRQAQPAWDGGTPAPPTHHWASARPLRAGLAAAALAALLALAAPAAAQTTTVPFLTNLDSSAASANTVVGGGARFQEAIRFVVGSETGPFLIDEVEFDVFSANAGAQPVVRLHDNSQTGTTSSPGAVVATFESPPALGTGLQTFRPPPGTEISLGPSGIYWITVDSTDASPSFRLRVNSSAGSHAGSGSRSGWMIHGRSDRRGTEAWASADVSDTGTFVHLRFALRGRVPFWIADLTAGTSTSGNDIGYGGATPGYGSLSDPTFSYGGTDYTVDGIYKRGTSLRFATTPRLSTRAKEDLTLVVGGSRFRTSDATGQFSSGSVGGISWSGSATSGFTLNDADAVKARLVARDDTGPRLESATVSADGAAITLAFDENLGTDLPAADAAGLVISDGTIEFAVDSLAVQNSSELLVGVSPAIGVGATVTVTYTDPTDGDDSEAIQDPRGNDAASFVSGSGGVPAVTNNSTVAAATAPGAPTGLMATADGRFRIDLSWTVPAQTGGSDIRGYRIEASSDGGANWTDLEADTGSAATAYTHSGLDPDTMRHYRVSAINAVDTGAPSNTDSATTDANQAPDFDAASVPINLAENTAGGENVPGADRTAVDPESDTVTYSFVATGGVTTDYQRFDLETNTGRIRTKDPIDYEAQTAYLVNVQAADPYGATDSVLYNIAVTDVNEKPAKPAAPAVSATSGSPTSLDVSWTAPGLNGGPAITRYDLQYRQGTSGSFTNGPQDVTGTSSSITGLDAGSSYQVQVRAENGETPSDWSDSGTGSTSSPTNNAPVITTTSPISVAENTTAVATLAATDADTGDTLTWSKNGGADADKFSLTAAGVLTFLAAPNFENPTDSGTNNGYAVTVRVSDGTANADLALTVNVTDVNEQPAKPTAPAVSATSGSNTSLDVNWTDPNLNGGPAITRYDLQYRQGTSGSFTDGPQDVTGTYSSITGLDAGSLYQVQVRAENGETPSDWSDPGTGSTSSPNMADNNAPAFTAGGVANRSLAENVGAATTATAANLGDAFTATDADSGDTLTYSLEGTDAGAFTVNSNTGQLRTRVGELYDFESQPNYVVVVTVDDGNGGSDRIVVTVLVADVDEPPLAPAAPTVSSGSTTSLTVVWSAPSNTGRPAISSYDLQYRQGTSGPWTAGPQNRTGTSATISSLAVGTAYQVQVRASNVEGDSPYSPPGSGSTNVADNNTPTFDEGSSTARSVDENTASGQDIGSPVAATDTDNDPLTYALSGTDARAFSIDTGTGQLRTRGALDHEAKTSHSVTITVSDGRGGTDSILVTIGVHDVDEPPRAPRAPRVTPVAGDDMSLQVTWSAPSNTGPPITGYDLQYRQGTSGPWTDGPQNVTGTSATITGLNPDTLSEVQVQVRVRNDEGESVWSPAGSVRTAPEGREDEPRTSAPTAPRGLTAVAGDGQVVLTWDAPSSDGGAKITDYEYWNGRSRTWTSIGSTDTTHTVTGLVNGAVYVFEVRAVNRRGRSRASNRAEVTLIVTLDFAHFANGGSIASDLVFVNLDSEPVRPAIYFYDTQGDPMAAESVVEVTGDLEVREDGALTVRTEMAPLGELTIATHGQGELVTGSVKVVSEGPIGGMLRFDIPAIGEAVVAASPPERRHLFPVRRREGGINTGVAIHNLEDAPMAVSCRLMRGGEMLAEAAVPLEANGQTSWFIDQAFPAADTSDFTGSVRCDAGGVSAVALEMDPGARLFITLPRFPVHRLTGGRPAALDFAHFANGGGLRSDLVFVNVQTQPSGPAPTPFQRAIPPVRPAIYFYDTEGQPMTAESVVDITGDLEIREDGALTVRTKMAPLGVLTIATHGRGDLVTGSVRVTSEGPIGGMLRFDIPGIGEAVVGATQPVSDAIFPARRREGGINTGVAIHNRESSPELVRCELLRGGVLLDSASFPLAANGQTSWFIDQAFATADTSDFTGSVRCSVPAGKSFAGVALELDAVNRIFTTLPVFPVPERPVQE